MTVAGGERVEGVLEKLDDFLVGLVTDDGTYRSFRIAGGAPQIEVKDPLQPHRELLRVYTDADIHNMTAYLVTLK